MTISLAINRRALAATAAAAFVIGAPAFGAEPRPVLDSPFFPFTYRWMPNNEAKLAELGYAPFGNLFVRIILTQEPPYPPDLEERIRKAAAATKGGGILWLAITFDKADLTASEAKAIEHVRKLAAAAKAAGWQTSIYPHTGDSIFTARQALPFVKKIADPKIGLTLNLAHELRNGQADDLLAVVDEVKDHLSAVTINGADRPVPGKNFGWDRLIQPLGRGDFEVYPLLQKLQQIGYTGPIGLQCFSIPGDPAAILAESMKAWQALRARLAAAK